VLGMPAGDTDFDFAFDSDDQTTLSGWSGAYQSHADVDLDGDVDGDDATANTTVTMGWDVLSSVGSKVGYAGYVQDAYVPTVNHVRYRVLKVDLGRWLQRDPAGYVDGASLYEYAISSPVGLRDPMGLAGQPGFGTGCGGSVGFDSCGGSAPSRGFEILLCVLNCNNICSGLTGESFAFCMIDCIGSCMTNPGGGQDCFDSCGEKYKEPWQREMRLQCIKACQRLEDPTLPPIQDPDDGLGCTLIADQQAKEIDRILQLEKAACDLQHPDNELRRNLCKAAAEAWASREKGKLQNCIFQCQDAGGIWPADCDLVLPPDWIIAGPGMGQN